MGHNVADMFDVELVQQFIIVHTDQYRQYIVSSWDMFSSAYTFDVSIIIEINAGPINNSKMSVEKKNE